MATTDDSVRAMASWGGGGEVERSKRAPRDRRAVLHRCRPGLAGGFDYDGRRARALAASGFAAIEFGSVAAHALPGGGEAIATLATRLAALRRKVAVLPAIGIGIGNRPGGTGAQLTDDWRTGLAVAAPVADYVSFNLSARERRHLLDVAALPQLERAFAALVACADCGDGVRPAVAVKLPLGPVGAPLPGAALAAVAAGVDGLIAVMPDDPGRFERLARLAEQVGTAAAIVAVGGIRTAADVAAALAAGACGIQVHRVFAERGTACLPGLRAGFGGVRCADAAETA
ncbi:MAG TPA: hypothetical protein PL143_19880 [Rhodocyclaceae bacterium]|nr:hypothetical protein [Rhodocyclaceae bacterium]